MNAYQSITEFMIIYWPMLLIIWGLILGITGLFFLADSDSEGEE